MANALHSAQTVEDGIHITQAFDFADAAARLAYNPTPEDIGKIALQSSDNTFWLLRDDSPALWVELASTTPVGISGVTLVTPTSSIPYPTIGDALAASVSGNLIIVGPGTYAESIVIPSGVVVKSSDGTQTTFLTGAAATGTRVVLGERSKFEGFQVTVPTDATPAISYSGSDTTFVDTVRLLGSGASGVGVRNAGTGIFTVLNLSYAGGTIGTMLESTGGGSLVCALSSFVGGTMTSLCAVRNSSAITISSVIAVSNITNVLLVEDGTMEVYNVALEAGNTGIRITNNAAVFRGAVVVMRDAVTNHLVVDPGVTPVSVSVVSGEMMRSRVSYDTAASEAVTLHFLDMTTGDKGIAVHGEMAIGRPGDGRELVVGEGDSYVQGMSVKRNTNLEVGTWDDITAIMASATGSTADAFPGLGAGNALYIGGDIPFPGIKILTTVAISGGAIIGEFWNGATWVALDTMSSDADEPYDQHADDMFGRAQSEQVRYEEITTWATKTLDGETKYWQRWRVSTAISTSPTLQQIKLHSNRWEANSTGFTEFFGSAEKKRSLRWHQRQVYDLDGAASGNGDILISSSIGIVSKDNVFADGARDGVSGMVEIPAGLDTSKPLVLKVTWIPMGTGGNVEFEVIQSPVEIGDTLDGTLPETSDTTIVAVSGDQVLTKTEFDFDATTLVPGEFIGFALVRDATGGNPNDTFSNAVRIVTIDIVGTFWN